jgi:polysaccharide biosynthesis/export protein
MSKFVKALSLIAGLALGACANDGHKAQLMNADFVSTDSAGVITGKAARSAQQVIASSAVISNIDSADYQIASLDVIEISVFGVPDLSRTVQVSGSGNINLPLIRTVHAGGRTVSELEHDIAARLEVNYMQAPQVSIFVKEFNSQRVTVDGAVMKPGVFPMNGRLTLIQAVALSQGLNPVADPSGVIVFRQQGNQRGAARFDLRAVRSGKAPDPLLQAGDIVMVDESKAKTTLRDIKDALPLAGLFSFF